MRRLKVVIEKFLLQLTAQLFSKLRMEMYVSELSELPLALLLHLIDIECPIHNITSDLKE